MREVTPHHIDARTASDEVAILDLLHDCQGGLSASDIEDELDLKSTYTRSLLESLERFGQIRREREPDAGRLSYLWFLT